MRRAAVALTVFVAFGGLVPVAAVSLATCTDVGTSGRDIMAGGRGHDKICALGGGDYVHADGKGDILLGGPGNDALIGGAGRDRIKGGQGSDRLFSVDQLKGNDVIRGGRGQDFCYADKRDKVLGCEHVNRSNSPELTRALSSSFLGVTELGEEIQTSPTPAPLPSPPGPPPTFPACTPPPFVTPAPC
jgi:hypothetical protein